MYRLISTTAYEPDPHTAPWVEPYRVIDFPDGWRDEFLGLYRRRWRRREEPVGLPIRKLNELLRAAAPGLVATGRGAGGSAEVPWFYASQDMPAELVGPLLASWVMTLPPADDADPERAADHRAALDRALAVIDEYSPRWRNESVDLTAARLTDGGTAQPDRRLYHLLPEQIGARLIARPLRLNGVNLSFRQVTRNQGVELVSWPPRQYTRGRRTWHYSALVTVTVQTVPFASRFRVHVDYGIRRWTGSQVWLPPGRGATVLLDIPLPWPGDHGPSHRLTSNTLAFNRRLGMPAWRRHSLVELLPEFDVLRTYPKPADLIADPADWLDGRDGVAAGVVHSTAMGAHGVGAGLMPLERSLVDQWVEEGLTPVFRRVAGLERAHRKPTPVLLPTAKSKDPQVEDERVRQRVRARRAALRAALDDRPLLVDVLWQTEETRDELVAALHEWLGLPPGPGHTEAVQEWQLGGLRVELRVRPLGSLGAALPLDGGPGRSRSQVLSAAVRERAARTAGFLGSGIDPVGLALVETLGPDRFGHAPDTDPKSALRHGCAAARRVSQFMVVPEDSEAAVALRARSALADGMRQLGAVVPPEQRLDEKLADDLQYLALWQVRRQSDGPTRRAGRHLVALRIRPHDPVHPVRGWDDTIKAWVPYADFLISLAADSAGGNPGQGTDRRRTTTEERRDEVERRIRSLLFQVRDRPTLLLANSGNLRETWPGLNNGQLEKDTLTFLGESPVRVALHGPDLRVVLLRDRNDRGETPQWYAPGATEEDSPGFSAGLWVARGADPDHRVYLSTVGKPPTAGTVRRDLRKLVPDREWPHGPATTAWNPQALELTVLGCLSPAALAAAERTDTTADRPAVVAAAAHQLRFHDEYHPLSRPLPLHLARLAEEYVLPLAPLPTTERTTE
ncbi:pPIWI_RE module domain-containing protein [Kitasatospora sp. NPDC056800]|uniref:pPIWI_RE module domain-containing protein n=1 Tax=Kitasatospora sp. NPDC056800 TaxID=3345948 RepID=UPI00367777A7